MKSQLIKILKIVVPLGLGVYLTWYFFSDLSEAEIRDAKNAFSEANYFWVALTFIIAVLGHLSRAYRWRFLLEPLGYKPKLSNAYHAVMSGYIINFTIPRSGEVARAGLLAQSDKVPFEKGFATIIVERLIDLIMLTGVVLITSLLQTKSDKFNQIMDNGEKGGNSTLWLIVGGMALMGCVGLVVYFKNAKIKAWVNQKLLGFWDGLKSVWTMKRKWAFLFHTFFIWATYIATLWIYTLAFPQTVGMPIEVILGAFVVGAAAIALLPGGIGVYPIWVTAVLALYDIEFAGFGIFVWVTQTVLIVVLGLISLFILQNLKKSDNAA